MIMPDWSTGWAIYTFTLGLAFYCGIMTNKLSNVKDRLTELKQDIRDEFEKLHNELETLRKAIGTRRTNG